MKIILVGSPFPTVQIDEIKLQSKNDVQFAAHVFQKKLISGFSAFTNEFLCISAPIVNSFPKDYKKAIFRPKVASEGQVYYVGFNNIFGIRNHSRANNILKEFKSLKIDTDERLAIISYSPSMGYVDGAIKIHKLCKNSILVALLPDLPQFVNIGVKKNLFFRVLKKYDISNFYRKMKKYDGFIFLSEYMNSFINSSKNSHIVLEGIASFREKGMIKKIDRNKLTVCYCGTLFEKYGIKTLIEAFELLQEKYSDAILNICGAGDCYDYVLEKSKHNPGIVFYGQLSSEECKNIEMNSNILVNPRPADEEFTKYSFPSKNIEYLETGLPVVVAKLQSIPSEYDSVYVYVEDNSPKSFANAIINTFETDYYYSEKYRNRVIELLKEKSEMSSATKIYNFCEKLFSK